MNLTYSCKIAMVIRQNTPFEHKEFHTTTSGVRCVLTDDGQEYEILINPLFKRPTEKERNEALEIGYLLSHNGETDFEANIEELYPTAPTQFEKHEGDQ